MRSLASSRINLLIVLLSFAMAAITCSGCARRQRSTSSARRPPANDAAQNQTNAGVTANPRININTAAAAELETLPGIGPALAQRIIEHRQKNGPFRRPEHLIMIRGFSDKRFRALRDLITVE